MDLLFLGKSLFILSLFVPLFGILGQSIYTGSVSYGWYGGRLSRGWPYWGSRLCNMWWLGVHQTLYQSWDPLSWFSVDSVVAHLWCLLLRPLLVSVPSRTHDLVPLFSAAVPLGPDLGLSERNIPTRSPVSPRRPTIPYRTAQSIAVTTSRVAVRIGFTAFAPCLGLRQYEHTRSSGLFSGMVVSLLAGVVRMVFTICVSSFNWSIRSSTLVFMERLI